MSTKKQTYESENTAMMWGYGLNGLSMTLMMLGSTLWIVILVALAWVVIGWLNHRTTSSTRQAKTLPGSSPTAREILSQRYARGEIDTAIFAQMQERLEASEKSYQDSRPFTGVR